MSSAASLHIANHLRLADRDLKDAIILHNCKSRNDAYHLEQAAEKLLLALLTSEGEFWRRQRRLAQPAFHLRRLKALAATMADAAAAMSNPQ